LRAGKLDQEVTEMDFNPFESCLVFRSDLIGEDEIRWDGKTLTIGRKVDVDILNFEMNLTHEDREFLRYVKVGGY
jgi:hypothetical protein